MIIAIKKIRKSPKELVRLKEYKDQSRAGVRARYQRPGIGGPQLNSLRSSSSKNLTGQAGVRGQGGYNQDSDRTYP